MAVNHPPDGYAGSIPVSPTKTPAAWLQTPEFSDIAILDPDGWDRSDPDDWQRPLTRTQFTAKMVRSTCGPRGRNTR